MKVDPLKFIISGSFSGVTLIFPPDALVRTTTELILAKKVDSFISGKVVCILPSNAATALFTHFNRLKTFTATIQLFQHPNMPSKRCLLTPKPTRAFSLVVIQKE